jgi:LPS-assembly protein
MVMLAQTTAAADAAGRPLELKATSSFDLPTLPNPPKDKDNVVFLRGDTLTTQNNVEMDADGHAEARRRGIVVFADHIRFHQNTNTVEATGHVRMNRTKSFTIEGPYGVYNLDTHQGYVDLPFFTYPGSASFLWAGRGDGQLLEFIAEDKERLTEAEYTTCPLGRNDWMLHTTRLDLDHTAQEGVAHNGIIRFFEVPILYFPSLTFPLDNQRKSGFLDPTIGATGATGQDISLPYYFNIAPNFDDTLTPRIMSMRGLQIGNDFRYLEPSFSGSITTEYLQHDIKTSQDRWIAIIKHNETFIPGLTLSANVQQASDANYLNDLSTLLGPPAQAYLPHDVNLSYSGLANWNFNIHSLSYQNLVGAIPQFRIEPQINANWSKNNWNGVNLGLTSQYTSFISPGPNAASGTVVVNGITYNGAYQSISSGTREVVNPTISFPFHNSYSFITFKTGVNFTEYDLGDFNTEPGNHYTRTLPITSIDSGLFFDRQDSFFGKDVTQTLEPRLYYVYIPYKNQNLLPVFDTSLADFNNTTIFSENQFNGVDRINNANQVTAAVTSRVINTDSGIEAVNAMVGQRFYFTPNNVLLPGQASSAAQSSDVLVALAATITQRWKFSSNFDFNQHNLHTQQMSLNSNYTVAPGKMLNASYRIDNLNLVRQWDLSSEWPITHQLSFLGRMAYSTLDDKVVEGLMGVEYNQGCWALRVISTRFAVSSVQTNSAFYVQLELGGMGLGQNPLQALRQNIPGYVKTNEMIP